MVSLRARAFNLS